MEPTSSINTQTDRRSEIGSFRNRNKDELLENDELGLSKSISRGLNKRVMLPHALYLKLKQYRINEKYLRRCLESIQISASKAARCNASINLSSVKTDALTESLSTTRLRTRAMGDLEKFVIACSSTGVDGNEDVTSSKLSFVGSIMGSKSMINILKSPLLQQLGITDSTSNIVRMDLNDIKGFPDSEFVDSLGGVNISSLKKLENDKLTNGSDQDGSNTRNERVFPTPSTSSICSDQSSSGSASTQLCQGMLQFTWKEGNLHFVFSVDNEKEIYVASSSKVASSDNQAWSYVYLFHSAKNGLKDHEVRDSRPCIVGKMTVSTSYSVCSNNSKTADTEFVLFGILENSDLEMDSSNNTHKRNKVFPRKVTEVFRTSNSSKLRNMPSFNRSGLINADKFNSADDLICARDVPPNFELCTVVVRDHLPEDRGSRRGGWGLKFLKQAKAEQTPDSPAATVQADCCARNIGKCSTSMDVLIPAGLHGGPRTRNCGPSTLKERWRSGGHCDCGGWDIGCPLTVLEGQLVSEDTSRRTDTHKCRAFNVHAKGLEKDRPALRMVNIRDGLYFVHFERKLSCLQSFSIAVAMIHSRSPALKTRNVQELK
ncbi:uncharacterized protein LOC111473196 isoform X2 [Cucurbita maxima]|uniref:Uncharacterized protein LOC111473196 isoform X2 n=1 Tax=Cucurbita maxima TaxID=3661 RepID=A0A6J1IHU2_CUCMA|nr:uncharacterized protein LOC111473196 isoform X2 [Cucurbita maxima]